MKMQNVNSVDAFTGRKGTAGTRTQCQENGFMDILNMRVQKENQKGSFDVQAERLSGQKRRIGSDQSHESKKALEKLNRQQEKAASKETQKAEKNAEKVTENASIEGAIHGKETEPDQVKEAQKTGAVQPEQEVREAAVEAAATVAEAGIQRITGQGIGTADVLTDGSAAVQAVLQGTESGVQGTQDGGVLQTELKLQNQTEGINVTESPKETQISGGVLSEAEGLGANPASDSGTLKTAGVRDGQAGSELQKTGQTDVPGEKLTTDQAAGQLSGKQEGCKAGQQEGTEGGTGRNGGESLTDQAALLKQMSAKNSVTQVQESTEKAGKSTSVEDLQKYVDEQIFANPGELASRSLSGTYEVGQMKQTETAQPIMEQFKSGIEQGITKNLDTFTIRLKPEGLGEILIHMEHAGGRIAMSIGVTNAETQKLLTSEMINLKEMLKPLNAEVKEIYQSQTENFDMMTYQQNLFHQNRNLFYAGKSGRIQHYGGTEEEVSEAAAEIGIQGVPDPAVYASGSWNAYV